MPFIPLHDANPLTHISRPYVAWSIIAANIFVFVLQISGIFGGNQTILISYGLIPSTLSDIAERPDSLAMVPDSMTLLTSAFLHADIWHLAGNMVFLWVFADNIEDALGHVRFLLFYVLSAVGAGWMLILSDPASQIPTIGASGAVAGVVAAYFMLHPKVRIWILLFARIPVRLSAFWVLGFWLASQFVYAAIADGDGVAWFAHIGGLLTGLVLVLFMRRRGVPLFDRREQTATLVIPPRRVRRGNREIGQYQGRRTTATRPLGLIFLVRKFAAAQQIDCAPAAVRYIVPKMTINIKTIGIIGAGQMGSGIAHVCALAGFQVSLNDVSDEHIKTGLATINGNMARQVGAGKISEESRAEALGRIVPASQIEALGDADLVIEAATENETIKAQIFGQVCQVLRDDALLATNTSSISVTRLAAATDRPEQFIGIHFMNPVPVMELIEIIRGIATSNATYTAARNFVEKLGKTPTVAEDFPGFIVNRILLPMINEAVYVLHEGIGTVEAIDNSMLLGAHHPMGPLQLADFIGLDTCLSIMQVLYDGLADSKYRPCPLLVKYVEAGWLGRKSGRGFYDYSGDKPKPTR
jgi:3-hydroxybutyryl-CoA dehydrogenase